MPVLYASLMMISGGAHQQGGSSCHRNTLVYVFLLQLARGKLLGISVVELSHKFLVIIISLAIFHGVSRPGSKNNSLSSPCPCPCPRPISSRRYSKDPSSAGAPMILHPKTAFRNIYFVLRRSLLVLVAFVRRSAEFRPQ